MSKLRFLKFLLLIPVALIALIAVRFKLDARIPYDDSTEGVTIPIFDEQEIDFSHHYEKPTAIQTAAGAIIQVDGKGPEELFLGGGQGQDDKLFQFADGRFADITNQVGFVKDVEEATMSAVALDVDMDGLEDLVVAHDTGQVRTWKNLGNLKFENVKNPNSDVYSYPMGIAVTDYDNNGLVDFFFSNTGTTAPAFMASGDLRDDQTYYPKWMMFRNDGDFKFTDSANETKTADYEFSWGAVFDDFNLDGRPDLVVSENYVDLPPHKAEFLRLPCRFMIQNTKGEFAAVGAEAGVVNKRYSISPLTADFNQDGAPDIVHVNLGGKSKVFLSKNETKDFVKVQLPNTCKSVGAMVMAKLSDGRTLYRPFVKGEGLCSDSTSIITIGTAGAQVTEIEIKYLDGSKVDGKPSGEGCTVSVDAEITGLLEHPWQSPIADGGNREWNMIVPANCSRPGIATSIMHSALL